MSVNMGLEVSVPLVVFFPGSVSGWFIHSSSRSYYLFFNYLSYYLYGGPTTAENPAGGGSHNSVENSPGSQ